MLEVTRIINGLQASIGAGYYSPSRSEYDTRIMETASILLEQNDPDVLGLVGREVLKMLAGFESGKDED